MNAFILLGILLDASGAAMVIAGIVSGEAGWIAFGLPLLVIGVAFWLSGLKVRSVLGGRTLGSIRRSVSGPPPGALPGRALVRAIGETGITINEAPVFTFDLEVQREGGSPQPVRVQQMVPRMLVGAVLPGHEVSVLVHPQDPSQVTIDWSEMPRTAGSPAGAPDPAGMLASSPEELLASIPAERRGSAAELLARGRRGTARLVGIRDMGDAVALGVIAAGDERAGARVVMLEMEVKLPGQNPYPATVIHWMPERLAGRIGPGHKMVVAVGRDNPERDVAVDWEAAAE